MNQIFSKQRKWFFIVFFGAVIFGGVSVFASPPAPTPVCRIGGVIKSVDFRDAYDEACLKEPYGCPTDTELHHPARYFFDVSINSASHVSGDISFNTCQNMYPVGKVQKIFINEDKVKTGDVFSANQKIDGVVRSFWGAYFDFYTLGAATQQKYVMGYPIPERYVPGISGYILRYLPVFTSSAELVKIDIWVLSSAILLVIFALLFISTKLQKNTFLMIVYPSVSKMIFSAILLILFGMPYKIAHIEKIMFRKLWDFNPVYFDFAPVYQFDVFFFAAYAVLVYILAASLYSITAPSRPKK